MRIETNIRSNAPEIMDDFAMAGPQLRRTLDEIAWINQLLGGNRITLDGVRKLLASQTKENKIRILDLGCGSGEQLRMLADFGRKHQWDFELIGIDANQDTVLHARESSVAYNNIKYQCINAFSDDFKNQKFDIALCTLTLHHFSDDDIKALLTQLQSQTRWGIVINDLQRSALACRLFQMAAWLLRLGPMPRHDGLVSIMRGFRRNELVQFSKELKPNQYRIRWKWAFRYQWIITNV